MRPSPSGADDTRVDRPPDFLDTGIPLVNPWDR
jgi:hypothetical protein